MKGGGGGGGGGSIFTDHADDAAGAETLGTTRLQIAGAHLCMRTHCCSAQSAPLAHMLECG